MTNIPQDILDYKLQHWLHAEIDQLPVHQRTQLKNIRRCCTSPIEFKGEIPAVYLMSNGQSAKFFGQKTCKNPWACPVCTARMMNQYRSVIATMLDMLRDKNFAGNDYFAYGLTLTIPHLAFMNCKETTDILYQTFRYFSMKKFSRQHGHAFHQFNQQVQNFWHVRVAEYTYGDNGWHPHFHCIFWIKRSDADKVLQWQERLNTFWTQCAKKYTLKYWLEHDLHKNISEDRAALCDKLYSKVSHKHPALKFSTNPDGSLMECLSSDYITGWGSDRELTGNVRKEASHENHFTVYQIMLKAQHDKKYRDIFIDYLLNVTRKPVHNRVRRSPGLTKLIKQYRQLNGYKKVSEQKKTEDWRIILFFDTEQWSLLCHKNKSAPVLSNLLFLATCKDKELLFEYLDYLNISCFLPNKSPLHDAIENLFNNQDTSATG